MSVYLRDGGFYQADFNYKGDRYCFSTGETTKTAALQKEKAKRRELELEHAAGQKPKPPAPARGA
jgi:hypothetical protein